MKPSTSSLGKIFGLSCCILVCAASGSFGADVVLHKAPPLAAQTAINSDQSHLGPQATFALVNYNVRDARTKARALYVSSGSDLKLANNMVDDQVATSFGFSAEDKSPTAVIDLGKVCPVGRLSATYSARPGSIDFYVMQSLPGKGDNSDGTVTLDSDSFARLQPVGSAIDDGSKGRVSVDFPATTGRYVMLRWTPAASADSSFTVAEVAAYGVGGGNLLASNGNFSSNRTTTSQQTMSTDSKDVPDSKDVSESKDIPEEQPPGEGPPPKLPDPPPFTFIPQLVPVSQ